MFSTINSSHRYVVMDTYVKKVFFAKKLEILSWSFDRKLC